MRHRSENRSSAVSIKGDISMRIGSAIALLIISLCLTGCSMTLHERKKDENNPKDEGAITQLQIRGPKAAVTHKF